MVDIPKFKDLPYSVRKSPRKRWDYLAELLGDGSGESGSSEPETPVVEQPATRDISITINDGKDPVQSASVVIGETTKTTGSAGGCTFNSITDGEHTVTVTADGFTEKTETITVSSENTSFTISLTAAVVETPGET
jgi:hypothetical protein